MYKDSQITLLFKIEGSVKFKAEKKAKREAASFGFIWGLGITQIIKKIIQSNSKKFSLHGYVKKKKIVLDILIDSNITKLSEKLLKISLY